MGPGLEATGLDLLANAAKENEALAGRAWFPGRRGGRRQNPGPLSDLLHVVSWEEALLAVQPAFPPARGIFHEDLDDLVHIEAQLVHILAHILVQCPAPRAMRPRLGLGSAHAWHRSLPHTALSLHACHTLVRHVKEFCVVL